MGSLKVLLPWVDGKTVLEQIVAALQGASIQEILVVTGHETERVTAEAHRLGARAVHNPTFDDGQMRTSLQTGLAALPNAASGALVVLGDQPQIEPAVVSRVVSAFHVTGAPIVAPSFNHRRGHPYVLRRDLWAELATLEPDASPRRLFERHAAHVHYVEVDSNSILRDIDSRADYEAELARASHR
jgi:molybdenum cofactor cytidylyltransferase